MIDVLHPGLILLAAALLILVTPENLRKILFVAGPALACIAVTALMVTFAKEGAAGWLEVSVLNSLTLQLMKVDKLSLLVVLIFAGGSLLLALFNCHTKNRFEMAAETAYAGSAMGVVLAEDWITMIVFWEVMAIASWLVVIASGTRAASRAGFRYLLVHMFGGNMLLLGIILLVAGGGFYIENLTRTDGPAYWLVLIGIAVNGAVPPLNAWIADAYPESTAGGTVYLGTYTTKVAIYCMIRCFAGDEMLLWVGAFMAIFGAAMALLENDLRRLLSYHIISQLGYMVVALAVGSEAGIDGAAAHLFNNILYKGTLLMCAGAILAATGKRKITEMGGLYKQMPLAAVCCLIASFSIAGFPLFNGFVSKGLIMNAIADSGNGGLELVMMVASVGTLMSITLKVNYFVFFKPAEHPLTVDQKAITPGMKIAMAGSAIACIVTGIFPQILQGLAPFGVDGHPYTVDHITQYIQLFAGAAIAFIMYLKHMAPHEGITLDTDWFYRKPLALAVRSLSWLVQWFFSKVHFCMAELVARGNQDLHAPKDTFARFVLSVFHYEALYSEPMEEDDVFQRSAGYLVAVNAFIFLAAAGFVFWKM